MPTSREWIPVEDRFELSLVDALVGTSRRFLKTLRYNAPSDARTASAVLLDTPGAPCPLYITGPHAAGLQATCVASNPAAWLWEPTTSKMPALPGADPRWSPYR